MEVIFQILLRHKSLIYSWGDTSTLGWLRYRLNMAVEIQVCIHDYISGISVLDWDLAVNCYSLAPKKWLLTSVLLMFNWRRIWHVQCTFPAHVLDHIPWWHGYANVCVICIITATCFVDFRESMSVDVEYSPEWSLRELYLHFFFLLRGLRGYLQTK